MPRQPMRKEPHERAVRWLAKGKVRGVAGNPMRVESNLRPTGYPATPRNHGNHRAAKRLDYRHGKSSTKDGTRTPGYEKVINQAFCYFFVFTRRDTALRVPTDCGFKLQT